MSIRIRPAEEADLPTILAITNDAILNTTAVWSLTPATLETRRAWLEERRSKGFPVLVAEGGGAVLGFASFGDFRPWEGYRHSVENSIYIAAGQRGRGLGRALLGALLDEAARQGKHVMVAGIEAGNEASIRLHAAFGFVETGRLRQVGRKFDRWLDLVLMQRILGE
ncbi:phosphinothricin acetyltransferase [Azospirillum agricola]|uniref:GNAT family N-acetyltransferase n=1 Tax=Azospirillum agricola TaxID=1720247 RepID=UPI001AE6F4BD|nr:GNAT family N-acetyltransferase [Azospirillum agricola]MBP2232207.1 phosphinothricin acetyltransferase [Azospirillum agricola]